MAEFEPVTEAQLGAITRQTERRRQQLLYAIAGEYDRGSHSVIIRLNNGVSASIPVTLLPGLANAAPDDLDVMVIEGRGYGLRFPALDADLSIPQLFADYFGSTAMRKAQNRTIASRSNGRLGGRPRKALKIAS